ncbi:MAG TPA: cation:proton antiporter [Longimicrobiales bacterium]|nr:cation:proton antiporter [Longimicrobiales bacterium]
MTDFPILQNLGYILITAAVAVLLLRLVKVPAIVAYMVTGLVLGPATGVLRVSESVELLSEAGIVLLLFLVGLELSLAHIRGVGRTAVIAGTIQIALTATAGWLVAMAFGLRGGAAVVLALAVTFSSTVVVVKLLGQKRALDETYGRIAIGVLLVQDAAVILALTMFAGLGGQGGDNGVGGITMSVLMAFGGMIALAAVTAFAAKFVLPRAFDWIASSSEGAFIWSLAWCFLFIIAAEMLHLSVELGAFLAGVGLAQLRFSEALRRRVQPIVNFFLAVFFVSLGLQMEPRAALAQWPLVLALLAVAMLVKPAIVLATLPRLGYDERTAALGSLTLAQMSEFSFILAALAAGLGMIDEALLSVITVAGFISIGISSYVIVGAEALHVRLRDMRVLALFGAAGEAPEPGADPRTDHIIVIGMNTLGRRLARELTARGETVLAVDTDAAKLDELGVADTLVGSVDDAGVLDDAGYTHARLVVSALQIEDTNNLLAYRCRRAGVPVSIHAFDTSLIEELREVGATHLMVSKHDGTREIAQRLRHAGVFD